MTASLSPEQTNKKKIGFVHLGCPKNLVDTETMLGLLEKDGHQIVASESEADLVLVNTCAFIDDAQKESVQVLVNLAEQGKRLMIAGCLAQKFQGELLDLFPEADAVVGTHNVPDISSVLSRINKGERVLAVQQDPQFVLEEDTVRRHVTVGPWVYVKVSEGCDYRCTFCIIPSMRGNLRSRKIENIVENVRELADRGVSEVVLVGQDNTSFGKDTGENLQWIRFLYAYPNDRLDTRLLHTIRDCDKVVKYLDCPLQHTHPDILKRMGRPIKDTVEFVDWIRSEVPDIRLRTSFITGFPGETEEHFQHMLDTVQRVEWDRLGVFEYSDVDTAASTNLDAKVPKKVMKARRKAIMELQQGISYRKNQALIGQTLPVIIDEQRPSGLLVGRTQWDAPEIDNAVLVKATRTVVPGEIVPVLIQQATPYDLKGCVAD
jgi:ribosomal protein S12 methylthiotransferase